MLCPKCNAKNAKEVSNKLIKNSNSFERKRKCINSKCLHEFSTVEKILKKRKTEARTEWLEFKIECYVAELIFNIWRKVDEYLAKNNIEEKFEKDEVAIVDISSNKTGTLEVTFTGIKKTNEILTLRGLKAATIRRLLKDPLYWYAYKLFFKKEASKEVKENEETRFANSIIHPEYGIKSGKYDVNFFKRNQDLHKFMGDKPEMFMNMLNRLH